MIDFEKIPTPPQEEDGEKTNPGISEKALKKRQERKKAIKSEEDEIETKEFTGDIHFQPTEIKMTPEERENLDSATTGISSNEEDIVDTEDANVPEEIRERTRQENHIIRTAEENLKDIILEGGTDEELKNNIFSLLEETLSEFGNERLDKIYVREKIFKGFRNILGRQEFKELSLATTKANLAVEDTPEKRQNIKHKAFALKKRYGDILKDIFDYLKLGEEKGGSFGIER